MNLDFYATQTHYVDHLAPIWKSLNTRGSFFVPEEIKDYIQGCGNGEIGVPSGKNPVIVSAYGDLVRVFKDNPLAKVILMEHGIGMTFGTPAYADGYGRRKDVSMFLVQSQYVANKFDKRIIAPVHIIGIPKLDKWAGEFYKIHEIPENPTIALSFHHSNYASIPEAQNAWDYYLPILPELSKRYHVIGTGHPLEMEIFSETYRTLGVEVVESFDEVMERADILCFDSTSSGYEFLVTGKPVVVLNCPKFRRDQNFGIRFWDYSNIGPNVNKPEDIFGAIELAYYQPNLKARAKAVNDLIPNIGNSTELAVKAIEEFLASIPKSSPKIEPSYSGEGILYMCFGERAKEEVKKSIASLRSLGMKYPIAIVGDTPVEDTEFIQWEGQSPFDCDRKKGLQFLAGRVKPFLYRLSPFQKTLYIDADTRYKKDIRLGFDYLNTFDIAIAQENQDLQTLHNPSPEDVNISWYHHMEEVQASIKELGDPTLRFWNSGVIFFKKGKPIEKLFENWYSEWMRWQQWDEQFSLLRAASRTKVNIKRLSIIWNCPRDRGDIFIFHCYARGAARKDGI
jgi:hypothetical protein